MSVVDQARVVEPVKVCAGPCGQKKPWSSFHPRTRWGDGTMRSPQGYCKECSADRLAEWRSRNPTRKRTLDQRADANRRRRRRGTAAGGQLDSAPFVAWLRSLGATSFAMAAESGMDAAKVRQFLLGQWPTVSVDTVDRALLHADAVAEFNQMYPLAA